jgi:threonine dehydratase
MTISPADVQTARRILAGAALRTPMLPSPKLSGLTGAEVFVKYENLQVTNSFKDRGAYVKLASLSEAQRRRGVIAMSIGNHAKAVAYHSQRLGIPATIVMPVTTPSAKVKDTEAYGAKVVLDGETLGECQKRAVAIARDHALILVPPYDDPAIIAGQGTVALEMFEEIGEIVDRPGVLGPIATLLGRLGANILEVDIRRLFLDVPAKGAKLDITIEARDRVHSAEILRALSEGGYQPAQIG